jgi:hypothetical protein
MQMCKTYNIKASDWNYVNIHENIKYNLKVEFLSWIKEKKL